MRLTQVQVQNFKCVDDSTAFKVGPITCLVGKNESGKSALLQALYRLNPVIDANTGYLPLEYPRRRWSAYKERAKNDPDNVLTTTWAIEASDMQVLDSYLGAGAMIQTEVTFTKGYDNVRNLSKLTIDQKKVVDHFISSADLHTEEAERLRPAQDVPELLKLLSESEAPSERETELIQHVNEVFGSKTVKQFVIDSLSERLPKFVYFADYDRLPGQVSITDLLERKNSASLAMRDRLFLALLDLAGTEPDALNNTQEFEALIAELEAIENRISSEIFKYWSQNKHLKVKFSFDAGRPGDPPPFNSGWVFRTRIENFRHGVSVPFDERSTGFVWFFSFLVWFSQLKKHYGDNLIVLLDEPGLSLHGKAQGDLVRYFNERIVPQSPLIYTTHSPFMVDPENLLAVRTVEDVLENDDPRGTKVGGDVLSTDRDTVFPLQAALCYDISQTLFIGRHTLLVEGPSDLLYLKWFSRQLRLRERVHLEPRWTISVAGGIDKIASFVTLFSGKGLQTAVFCDYHQGDKKKIERLRALKILAEGHVITANLYTGEAEADTEDMMGAALYEELVKRTYRLGGSDALVGSGKPGRVVVHVKNHFATLSPDAPEFDHYEPAVYLTGSVVDRDAADALPNIGQALDRFEALFMKLNALLLERAE